MHSPKREFGCVQFLGSITKPRLHTPFFHPGGAKPRRCVCPRSYPGLIIIQAYLRYNQSYENQFIPELEARLQTLIEGSAARLFPQRDQTGRDLAERLVRAMQNGITPGPHGALIAPNLFTLRAAPTQSRALQQNQALLHELVQVIKQAGSEHGLQFPSPPVIRVYEDTDLSPGQIKVWARNSQADLSQTADMELASSGGHDLPQDAFLIVDGNRIYTLDQLVINIGRRPDNQVVIEDPPRLAPCMPSCGRSAAAS